MEPKPEIQYLKDVYRFDPSNNAFTIQVSVEGYDSLFMPIDPSPVVKRDLTPDLLAYLRECSAEIPLKYEVDLAIQIRAEPGHQEREGAATAGLRYNFRYEANWIRTRIHRQQRQALKYVLFSFLSLSAATLMRGLLASNLLFDFLKEGLTIGAWVFLWESVTKYFIQGDDERMEMKYYERLARSKISFIYQKID